ncbi:MAG: hypothetical protein AAFN09_02360 [Pseudomonadota bacterium]
MSAPFANLLNALCLIVMSVWAFLAIEMMSLTALIPAGAGVALLLCQPGVSREDKVIAHIAVLVTFLMLIALVMPLRSALSGGDTVALIRVLAMFVTGVLAMVAFIKSFRDARKAREAAGG